MKFIQLSSILDQLQENGLLISTRNLPQNTGSCIVCYPLTDTRSFSSGYCEKLEHEASGTISSFVCISGSVFDGHDYIEQAVNHGVRLLILEKEGEETSGSGNVIRIIVSDSRKALASLAALYYEDPSSKLYLIGVTGTNGKTSIVKILEKVFLSQGISTGSIGTLGYTINGKHFPLERTTPDITELHQILSKMAASGVSHVVMEVSSHSLKLDRVYGLKFDMGIFTNLSREHLDFHSGMEDYFQNKKKLFAYLQNNSGIALINTDDGYGARIFAEYYGEKYAISAKSGDLKYRIIKTNLSETAFEIQYNDKFSRKYLKDDKHLHLIKTPLLGEHNALNITSAVSAAKAASPETRLKDIITSLPDIIRGRLQKVENRSGISCFIDYAHTPAALESVCETLSNIISQQNDTVTGNDDTASGRLICVVGAGGNRDRGKRREMTNAVLKYADPVIITSDNPRKENPSDIILDMVEHLSPLAEYWMIVDRQSAIECACSLARENDVLLIAGKGHETYQELADGRRFFNDYQVAQKAIEEKYKRKKKETETRDPEITGLAEQSSISPATIDLTIPLYLLQVKLLLEYRDKETGSLLTAAKDHNNSTAENAKLIRDLRDKGLGYSYSTFETISTDTRTIKDRSIFLALQGDNFDGHDYVAEALKFENNWAVVNKDYELPDLADDHLNRNFESRIIRVEDTQQAYGLLAGKYRSLFKTTLIAITGSSGKTTTKEFCYNILSVNNHVLKNFANENNLIGLCKTLMRLSSSHDYAVIEIGSNHFGEIKILADICQPDIGIITNIGPSHLEFFGDLQGVFREKTALLHRDLRFGIIPKDDMLFENLKGKYIRLTFAPTDRASLPADVVQVKVINSDLEQSVFKINGKTYKIPGNIRFNIQNAAFAVVLARKLGLSKDTIQAGLDLSLALKDRMEIFTSGNRLIISDCYNANPLTMKAAISYWLACKPELPHVAILGDMLELGKNSAEHHKEIAKFLTRETSGLISKPQIITVGSEAKHISNNLYFTDAASLIASGLLGRLASDAVILLKASHGIHLEKIKGRL